MPMLPSRRSEPELRQDFSVVFQEIIDLTEGRTDEMSGWLKTYAERGEDRIRHPDADGASPADFAQLILNTANLYPQKFAELPCLQETRARLESLLGQNKSVAVSRPESANTERVPLKLVKDKG